MPGSVGSAPWEPRLVFPVLELCVRAAKKPLVLAGPGDGRKCRVEVWQIRTTPVSVSFSMTMFVNLCNLISQTFHQERLEIVFVLFFFFKCVASAVFWQ